MSEDGDEVVTIRDDRDIIVVRNRVRRAAKAAGLSSVGSTKLITAASELARNTLVYGGGGTMTMSFVERAGKRGVRLAFADEGPGIADVEEALRDGFTSGKGLGHGLGGARRLCNEFTIDSAPGAGTRVVVTRWR